MHARENSEKSVGTSIVVIVFIPGSFPHPQRHPFDESVKMRAGLQSAKNSGKMTLCGTNILTSDTGFIRDENEAQQRHRHIRRACPSI
jgi:hypothetical protein